MDKVPLADWLCSIRKELTHASSQYAKQGAPEPGFILQNLTLEVEVVTEASDSTEVGFQLWVVSGKLGGDEADSLTQKMTLTFKPFTDIAMGDDDA